MLRRNCGPVARLAAFSLLSFSLALLAPQGLAAPPDGKGPGNGNGGGKGGGKDKGHPVANDDSGAVVTFSSTDINLLGNDEDPNFDPLSIVSISNGGYGSVVPLGDDSATYTADNTAGLTLPAVDTFTYVITDGQKKSKDQTGTVTVTITGLPPTAEAGPDQSPADTDNLEGEDVTLDGSASTDPNNDIVDYAWTWTGGSASGVTPTVNLPNGATVVTLEVTDQEGATSQDTLTVTVAENDFLPVADAGADQTVADTDNAPGEMVTLNGAGSSDVEGAVTYDWTWAGGSASGVMPTVSLGDGLTTVTLTVTDGAAQTDVDTVDITVLAPALPPVGTWGEAEVRRVLHACCYGGQATDAQIAAWSAMTAEAAVAEILSFAPNNPLLSPPEDAFVNNNDSLRSMQMFWGGSSPDNTARLDMRQYYAMSRNNSFSMDNLERTWWEAVNSRGGNPFLHKIGFFITNHYYAASGRGIGALMQPYYDEIVGALSAGSTFTDIQYLASSSAALSRYYGHQYNRFYRDGGGAGGGAFYGNDDFAREYFQLGMRIDAADEYEYHENVTIENMAKILSGMDVDRDIDAYDTSVGTEDYVAPIDGTTHEDPTGRLIRNASSETLTYVPERDNSYYGYHHHNCVEVLHQTICGANSDEKIAAITEWAAEDPEALAGIPIRIVGYLFDDNLTPAKTSSLQSAWAGMPTKDLLAFLRQYFASAVFHSEDTYKYANSFDYLNRIWVNNTTSNADSHANARHGRSPGDLMGAVVFEPARAVFGAQTGLDVANGPNIILTALNRRVSHGYYHYDDYIEANATNGLPADWVRDWGSVIPDDGAGQWAASDITDWLWNRFIGDMGENLGAVERSQIQSLLATGDDFNWRMAQAGHITEAQAEAREFSPGVPLWYGTDELEDPATDAYALDQVHAATTLALGGPDSSDRRWANQRVGYAVNFIATLPFMFVFEGK